MLASSPGFDALPFFRHFLTYLGLEGAVCVLLLVGNAAVLTFIAPPAYAVAVWTVLLLAVADALAAATRDYSP